MSQITRGQLKSIVKECLVEILSEGLLRGKNESVPEPTKIDSRPQQSKNRIPPRSESPALKSVSFGTRTPSTPQKKIAESAVRNHVGTITSDPVMSQILEDTATTTLQEQIYAERVPGRPSAADVMTESSQVFPDEFLTESAKNWSTLAFSETPRNR